MNKKLLSVVGSLVVVGGAIGLGFFHKRSTEINPNLEYSSIQPQQPRLLLSESQGQSQQPPTVVQKNLNLLYVAIQSGDVEGMRAAVATLRPLGQPVSDQIRLTLSEISWSNIAKRRNYFYMVGLLKMDQGFPLIEEELVRSDEVMSMEAYKSKQGLEMNDEALRESLLHHGTDVLVGENGTIRVSYVDSQVGAVRALGMIQSPEAKAKLREVALREDRGLVTQTAVQTFLMIASEAERKDLLEQISEDKMRQLLVPADFKKFFHTDPTDVGGETDKSP